MSSSLLRPSFAPRIPRHAALGATTAFAALIASGPAIADVTAQQVWDMWKASMDQAATAPETEVSVGSETLDGGVLTVTDLTTSFDDGGDGFTATISEIVFSENGDGTVSVEMSDGNAMELRVEGVALPILLTHEDLEITASGTPEAITYNVTAARSGLEMVPGEYDEVQVNSASFSMSDVSATSTVAMGDMQDINYSLSTGAIAIEVNMEEPDGPGLILGNGQIEGLDSTVDGSMPLDMATMEDPAEMFNEGFAMVASYAFGASTYDLNFNADGESGQFAASSDGGSLFIDMAKSGFAIEGGAKAPQVSVFGFELPFPVEVALDEYNYSFVIPLAKGDAPQGATISLALRDLTLNELLWSMADPLEALPRDPASIVLNLTGEISPLFDLLDPAQQMQAAMSQDLPVAPNSVTLNELLISAVGAEITGSGAFTFDNEDTTTFDGFPAPEGALTLSAKGVNGLMDTLIEMGLLPQEQAMGARMMMGMFAQAVGEDELSTEVEINAEGHIIVNDQRMR